MKWVSMHGFLQMHILTPRARGNPIWGLWAVASPGLLFCSPLGLNGVSLTRACCFWACLPQKEEFQRPQGISGFLCRIKKGTAVPTSRI